MVKAALKRKLITTLMILLVIMLVIALTQVFNWQGVIS